MWTKNNILNTHVFWCSGMINLQQRLIDLCDKAKSRWQKMDPVVTSSDDNCMDINQAIHYIAHHLKLQEKVTHYIRTQCMYVYPTMYLSVVTLIL